MLDWLPCLIGSIKSNFDGVCLGNLGQIRYRKCDQRSFNYSTGSIL